VLAVVGWTIIATTTMLPRVVLAEDDVLLREGLASLLDRSGFEVIGQAGDAAGLLALVAEQAPELVVVDIRMPPGHRTEGLEAARQIRREHPEIGILVLSAHVEVDHAMELLAGGRGWGTCSSAGSARWRSSWTPWGGWPGGVGGGSGAGARAGGGASS
jgi:CheY-like chemotaxis protein